MGKEGLIFPDGDLIHMLGPWWWVVNTETRKVSLLMKEVPWNAYPLSQNGSQADYPQEMFEVRSGRLLTDQVQPLAIFETNHFGPVLQVGRNSRPLNQYSIRIVFKRPKAPLPAQIIKVPGEQLR